jgi:Carboxylesterase family
MGLFNNPAPEESEDCLYLNVFTPATPGAGRAVLVWLYGGSLQFGSSGLPGYDGSHFAGYVVQTHSSDGLANSVRNQDVVIVTLNYRTNGKLHRGLDEIQRCKVIKWANILTNSLWFPQLTRAAAHGAQSWLLGSTSCS